MRVEASLGFSSGDVQTMTLSPEKLSDFMNHIKVLNDETVISICKDGWHVLMKDVRNITLMDIHLPIEDFIEYRCEHEWDAGILVEKMGIRDNKGTEIGTGNYHFRLQPVNPHSETHVQITRGIFTITRKMISAMSCRKKLNQDLINTIRGYHTHEFKFDTKTLTETMSVMDSVCEYVVLEGTENTLKISSEEGGSDTCEIKLPTEFTLLKADEGFISRFSAYWLKRIIKTARTDELTIRVGTDAPIEISMQTGEHGTCTYALAPRVIG